MCAVDDIVQDDYLYTPVGVQWINSFNSDENEKR